MKIAKVVGTLMTGSLAAMFAACPALAADVTADCVAAVSALNGKVEIAGGYRSDDGNGGSPFLINDDGGQFAGVGSLSIPLGCMFGAQFDIGGGDIAGSSYGGVAGHLFMRDPSQYLVGLHAQYISLSGEDLFRVGPEFELYMDSITLTGTVQYEHLDSFNTDNILAAAQVSFYATEDFMLSLGYRHFLDVDVGTIGLEYQPESFPASLFADAMAGSDDFVSVMAGLRFHFGAEDKSLMARHREDDPAHFFNLLREPVCEAEAPILDSVSLDPCGGGTVKEQPPPPAP